MKKRNTFNSFNEYTAKQYIDDDPILLVFHLNYKLNTIG